MRATLLTPKYTEAEHRSYDEKCRSSVQALAQNTANQLSGEIQYRVDRNPECSSKLLNDSTVYLQEFSV